MKTRTRLDDVMTRDSTSTPTPTPIPTPVDKSSAAYLKRREQVRRAQRTHRERKESYIHALESEVLALRTKARSAEEKNEALSLQIKELRERVDTQQANAGMWSTTAPAWTEVQGDGVTSASGGIEEQWLSAPVDAPTWEVEAPTKAIEAIEVRGGAGTAVVRQPRACKSWSMSVWYADMAMEFVMTLEKPCIQRAQTVVFEPLNTYPLSHSTGSTELALYHSFVEEELVLSGSCTQADVASSLDNLLALSSAFYLENEVTPVQAWQQLCGHIEIGAVNSKALRALVDALLEHVRCYGFEAVISKSVLDATCSKFFTMGTV